MDKFEITLIGLYQNSIGEWEAEAGTFSEYSTKEDFINAWIMMESMMNLTGGYENDDFLLTWKKTEDSMCQVYFNDKGREALKELFEERDTRKNGNDMPF